MRWIPVIEAQTENPKPRRTSAPEFLPLYLDNSNLAAPVSLLLFSSRIINSSSFCVIIYFYLCLTRFVILPHVSQTSSCLFVAPQKWLCLRLSTERAHVSRDAVHITLWKAEEEVVLTNHLDDPNNVVAFYCVPVNDKLSFFFKITK